MDNPYQAELALQLLEMNFSEDDALSAAKECSSLCSALSYLQQECDLCTGKFSAREVRPTSQLTTTSIIISKQNLFLAQVFYSAIYSTTDGFNDSLHPSLLPKLCPRLLHSASARQNDS